MSYLIVKPSELEGTIQAKPSKSYTHRLLSIALLAEGESRIHNPLVSLDTKSTLRAVDVLGGEIEGLESEWRITGTGGSLNPDKRVLDVGNSGTTIRLMSAVSALSPETIRLTGDESILKRPMGPLIKSLSDLGARAKCEGREGRPPVVVGGGLEGGETGITGLVSSQFVSALLIASPYSEVGVDLEVQEGLRSSPYVRMTLKTLELADAEIGYPSSLMSFNIPGRQVFDPIDFTVPGDFSSAAIMLGAGALSEGGVEVKNLDPDDVQGDSRIIDILKEFGADVKVGDDYVVVAGAGNLQGVDLDCSDIPDLVPILAVLGAFADGQTRLYNVPHLRYKEVDRIRALAKELGKMGVEVKELEDGLKVIGTDRLKGARLDSYGDHRMAMVLTVAGLFAKDRVTISNAESISVSYPGFIEDVRMLGGLVESSKD